MSFFHSQTLITSFVDRNRKPGSSNFFALIIGINKYPARPHVQQLSGAVNDAMRIVALLRRFNVQDSHILTLYDEEATRDRILQELESLKTDSRITKYHNTIFIYFAGHGSSMDRAVVERHKQFPRGFWDGWHEDRIELLCPSDIGQMKDGIEISGIPDKMIACYLNELAKAKGDNIVLMLDCCFSAGLTRHGESLTTNSHPDADADIGVGAFRYLPDPPPFSLSDTFWESVPAPSKTDIITPMEGPVVLRKTKIPSGFQAMYNGSHILLAACGRKQRAREHHGGGGGHFTNAFLQAIESTAGNLSGMSYRMLFKSLPIPETMEKKQTPHCDGRNVGREVFSLEIAEQAEHLIDVVQPKFVMMAGFHDGIEVGNQITVFLDPADGHGVSATVATVDTSHSQLDILSSEYQLGAGNYYATLCGMSAEQIKFEVILPKPVMMGGLAHGVRGGEWVDLFCDKLSDGECVATALVSQVDIFQSQLDLSAGLVLEPTTQLYAQFHPSFPLLVFSNDETLMDPAPSSLTGLDVRSLSNKEESHLILTSTAEAVTVEFNSMHVTPHLESPGIYTCGHINRRRIAEVLRWSSHFMYHLLRQAPLPLRVSVELYALVPLPREGTNVVYQTLGPNLNDAATNCANIGVDGSIRYYGIRLRNHESVAFYPYVASFDSDLRVSILFEPQFGVTNTAPIDGTLEPDCSSDLWRGGAMLPVQFGLHPGCLEDISVWRVFLATARIEVSSLKQKSVLGTIRRGDKPAVKSDGIKEWGAISVAIIQRRSRTS